MTMDRMALAELLEKGSDSDLLREMISFVAQRLMDYKIETICNVAPDLPPEADPEVAPMVWTARSDLLALADRG